METKFCREEVGNLFVIAIVTMILLWMASMAKGAEKPKIDPLKISGSKDLATYNPETREVKYSDGVKPEEVINSLVLNVVGLQQQLAACQGAKDAGNVSRKKTK